MRRLLAGVLAWLPMLAAAGERVVCSYEYGGEEGRVVAEPVASPYAVRPVAIGSYFLFRLVVRAEPADLASVKTYVYADRDEGPTLLHQGIWPYAPGAGGSRGFTGLHFVYEPVRDGELRYWCGWETTRR